MKGKLFSKVNLTPRQRQIRFRNTIKKAGYVVGCATLICFFIGTLCVAGKADYEVEIASSNEPYTYTPVQPEPIEFTIETRTEEAVLVRMEGETLVFRTEDGHEFEVTGEVSQVLTFGDLKQTPDDITDDVVLGWE